MKTEYLIFNLFVLSGPLAFSYLRWSNFRSARKKAILAACLVAVPYIAWDIAVTGSHWHFNRPYTLNARFLGLPAGEWLFFVSVPFACLFSWETLFFQRDEKAVPLLSLVRWCWVALLVVGMWVYVQGLGYTGLMLIALGLAALVDIFSRTEVLLRPRTYAFLGFVCLMTLIFNGYLTARPVVLYEASQQIGFRVWTIPIEDFGYGISLMLFNVVLYQRLQSRVADPSHRSLADRWVEGVFGGYKHQANLIDQALPYELSEKKRVAVVGAGLAGLSAAVELSKRGYEVVLMERNEYLGGKVGSWKVPLTDDEDAFVSHGFHAFFKHYYNLNKMLGEVGNDKHLKSIDDYLILDHKGNRFSFRDVWTTPPLNLLSLALHGVYSFLGVLLRGSGPKMESFMRYDRDKTFAAYDEVSFAAFSKDARLPDDLKIIFNTFSRAFFASPEKMSMAQLIKSFHFYYLSHHHGLIYDYFDDDYDATLLGPIRSFLESRDATIRLEHEIDQIEWSEEGLSIDGEAFDSIVLAADVVGAGKLVGQSKSIEAAFPTWHAQMSRQKCSQRYSVLRLWIDRDLDGDLSPFFITDRYDVLDAVAIYHRLEKSSAKWVAQNGGAIIELHSYAVPDEVGDDQEIRRLLLAEFDAYFPHMQGYVIKHEHLQVRRDFAAFHVGLEADRPGTVTDVPGLFLAGDWVKLPYPAMLMEGACMSGVLGANEILKQDGLQEEPVFTVPLRGFLVECLGAGDEAEVSKEQSSPIKA